MVKVFLFSFKCSSYIEKYYEELKCKNHPSERLKFHVLEKDDKEKVEDVDDDVERHDEYPWDEKFSLVFFKANKDQHG